MLYNIFTIVSDKACLELSEFDKMLKFLKHLFVLLSLLLLVLTVYTFLDNNRTIIVEQQIVVDDLSEELDGFTILQITDLHEKEFGENQKRLISKINSLTYDAIIFTGDMLDNTNSENYKPFYDLIEGIEDKENAWFVPGNADPLSYMAGKKSEFISGMEKRGVKLLEKIETVTKGDSEIHFVDFEMSIRKFNFEEKLTVLHPHQMNELPELNDFKDSDVLIALSHYPVVDNRIDSITSDPKYVMRNFDLIIAGHYHGGQIRLPLIGALFVPEAWDVNNGLFPPQNRVKGLWEYKGIKQYVSTGLGSSDAISFLKFRLFNTPEINLLTLKKK